MAYSSLVPLDDFTNREWNACTRNIEDTIAFCQLLGLIAIHLRSPCSKEHEDWYLGAAERYQDEYFWDRRKSQANHSTRYVTYFSAKA